MKTFQEPLRVTDKEDCYFYHCMELPGVGEVAGDWDLRPCIDEYLGHCDFQGKRALDVGTASGFLSFEMEKRGAEVVSFDMPDARSWNIVPRPRSAEDQDALMASLASVNQRLRNSYWFAHRQLGSRAKAHYGDVYDLPAELGTFDIVLLGTILSHLRDPLGALISASRLCRDTMVISDMWLPLKRRQRDEPLARLRPTMTNEIIDCWWQMSVACAEQFLGVLGFRVTRTVEFEATLTADGGRTPIRGTCVVARRADGPAPEPAST